MLRRPSEGLPHGEDLGGSGEGEVTLGGLPLMTAGAAQSWLRLAGFGVTDLAASRIVPREGIISPQVPLFACSAHDISCVAVSPTLATQTLFPR